MQVVPLRREEALGSVMRLITEKEAPENLRTLRVSLRLYPSAQSYSALPVVNVLKIG